MDASARTFLESGDSKSIGYCMRIFYFAFFSRYYAACIQPYREAIKQIKYLAAFLFLSSSIHPSFFESLLAACYLLVAVCSYLLCEQLLSSLFLRLWPKP